MGILANSVSLCQFQVVGDLPQPITFEWARESLAGHGFRSIDQSAEELSVGWVHLDDPRQSGFEAPQAFWRDHYLCFSLRRDQRRLPGPLLKGHLEQAHNEFLRAHPGLQRVPKAKREELREAVRGALLARVLPTPATYDAVWDTRANLVYLATLNPRVGDLFDNLFRATFPGLRLVPVHPFARAGRVIDQVLLPELEKANRATSDGVLELIRDNRWLGADFLLWLMHRTLDGAAGFEVKQPGHVSAGEPFTAYLNDRLILNGGGETGVQKVSVIGPQDHFREVCTALQAGKEITEATLYMEKGEEAWRLTLKGEAFRFASFRSPGVRLEKDDLTDPAAEREALFFERMLLLETGLQMFDSLYAAFLAERLAPEWGGREKEIRAGLAAA